MKQLAPILLLFLLAFAPAQLRAQFNCSTNTDGTLTITNYSGPGGNITFPTTINGLTVTGIGTDVMVSLPTVTSVTIPGSITNLAPETFYECNGITNAVLGYGITSIPGAMFNGCFNLASVTIPASVKSIGTYAFFDSRLAEVTLPSGITSIDGAFANCPALTNINLPFGITNIAVAFAECSSLPAITLPSTVTVMDDAFNGCTSLTNVVIPGSVTSIGQNAFYGCTSLKSITIQAGVTSIGSSAFYNCTSLASLAIPASVTNIAGGSTEGNPSGAAFQGCSQLSNLAILGAPNIETNAFYLVTNLASVSIAGGQIGEGAFQYCLRLTNLTLGRGVTTLGEVAFQSCPISSRLYIPSSIASVESFAFEYLQADTLVFGAGVSSIGAFSFYGDQRLTNVLFLGNAPYVAPNSDVGAFSPSSATVYYLPNTTGWSNTFGAEINGLEGSPTALWNPGIQTSDGHFGVSNGVFGFNITNGTTTNIPIAVLACTDLANPVWTPLTNVMLTNTYYFTDPQSSNYPNRYYGIGFP